MMGDPLRDPSPFAQELPDARWTESGGWRSGRGSETANLGTRTRLATTPDATRPPKAPTAARATAAGAPAKTAVAA